MGGSRASGCKGAFQKLGQYSGQARVDPRVIVEIDSFTGAFVFALFERTDEGDSALALYRDDHLMTTACHVELHRMQMFVIGTRVRKNDFEVRCASVARCAMETF